MWIFFIGFTGFMHPGKTLTEYTIFFSPNNFNKNDGTILTYFMSKFKMKSYCLKCRKDTENVNPRVSKISNGRTMVLSKCNMRW